MIKLKKNKIKQRFLIQSKTFMFLLICFPSIGLFANKEFSINSSDISQISDRTINVKGKIIAASDQMPLPGVSVLIKGTTIGVVSDFNGNFSIDVPSEESILVINYLGYKTKEVKVGNQKIINISLEDDVASLDEIVIVGYGAKKKESLTGSIDQVKSEVFQERAVTSAALALQGQTPGLNVTRSSSRPGNEEIKFQIRGATSINGGAPLIMIDGSEAIGSEFYQMNPDDIESVSVLKDGSASIYGVRAANGVILVTTKRGKGKMKVEYSGNFRYNTIGIRPPASSMEEYATMFLDAGNEDGQNYYWGWASVENLTRLQNGEEGIYSTPLWGDIFIGRANRFDELFGDSSSYQHNIGISGTSEKTRYRLSAMVSDSKGALKTAYDGQKQYNIRFNYDYDISEKLSLKSGITYQQGLISSPSSGLDASAVSTDPPFFPAQNPYGQWYANFNVAGNRNATAATIDGGREDRKQNLTKLNLSATYKILEGLDFTIRGSYTKVMDLYNEQRLTIQPYQWNGDISAEKINGTSLIIAESRERTYQNYGGFFNYKKSLDKGHNFAFMGGITAELFEEQLIHAERQGIDAFGVYDLNVATGLQTNRGGAGHSGLYAFLTRFNYDYKEKYLLELIGRRDGSSRFDEGYKFNNFGSVTAGWLISKEKFLEDTAVNYLKLRGSYGTSGNQSGIGLYDYLSQLSIGTLPFGTTPGNQSTVKIDGITTNVRTWEKVIMKNIGLDFGFLNNRLTGSFDLYEKENVGMLIKVVYPDLIGGEVPTTNDGNMKTNGWEASLGWKDTKGDFSYNFSVNIGDSRNKVVNVGGNSPIQPGLLSSDDDLFREGYPINSYFLFETDGLFQTQEEVDDYYATYTALNQGILPSQSDATQNIRVGDTRKVDLNGNGYIDQGDVKYMGDSSAHYNFGINLGGSYKNFDISAMFQGVLSQNVLRTGYMQYPFWRIWTNQSSAYLGQTWTANNTEAIYPRLTLNSNRSAHNWANNDFLLQNNRYIRLKNLVVGYNLPKTIIEKLKMDKVRVYFTGNDLFEFTKVKDGFDPEFGDSTQSVYPFTRTYALGLNLIF